MHLLVLKFPGIDPVALQLGPISIKWYGLAYVAGLLLGWLYIRRLLETGSLWPRGKAPHSAEIADDLFLFVALGVVIGGRLGNVLLWDFPHYWSHPLEVLQIWKGGMAFHGAMLGGTAAIWLFARWRHVSAWPVLDIVAAAVPIGLFFGRIANFINAEVVGREATVPWAMVFPGYGPNPRHPSQLYEAILEGLVLFLLLRWLIHSKGALQRPGLTGGAFLAGYGLLRTFCELFKYDEYRTFLGSLPLTSGMVYCIPMVIAGLLIARRASNSAEAKA